MAVIQKRSEEEREARGELKVAVTERSEKSKDVPWCFHYVTLVLAGASWVKPRLYLADFRIALNFNRGVIMFSALYMK